LKPELNLRINVIAKLNEAEYEMPCTLGTHGRRKLAFEKSSERSKRRNSKELRKIDVSPELTHAAPMSLGPAGKTDAAKIFSKALETTPKGALTLRRLMSYVYGAPILDVSRSHTRTQHSR